jgi:hypothetical protein
MKASNRKNISRKWGLYCCKIVGVAAIIFSPATGVKAGALTTGQQLEMYRNCRKTYEGYNLYFAKKMCGCTVQAYVNDIPAEKAGIICNKYAKTN